MHNYTAGIILLLFAGFIPSIIPLKFKSPVYLAVSFTGAVFSLLGLLPFLFSGSQESMVFAGHPVIGDFKFALNPVSAFFALIITVSGSAGILYAEGHLKGYSANKGIKGHYVLISLLISSMLALVMCRNVFAFMMAWELMSLASFFLVMFEGEKEDVFKAGINYFIIMHIGAFLIGAGFVIGALKAGSFDIGAISVMVKGDEKTAGIIFLLLAAGFAVKAGLMPFHTWLPRAHPAAPSHVSGMMSGVMIKMGVFGILLDVSITGFPELWICYLMLALSVISAVLGIIYAAGESDMKKILAYSSVENIGIIMAGFSLGFIFKNYGNVFAAVFMFAGAFLHALFHSFFKELLFFGAGAVYQNTHTRNIEELGGLSKKMKATSYLFLRRWQLRQCVFGGFISEFLIYAGIITGAKTNGPVLFTAAIMSAGAVSLTGGLAIIAFTRLYSVIFSGAARSQKTEAASEANGLSLAAMYFLAFMCLAGGVLPQYFFKAVSAPVAYLLNGAHTADAFAVIQGLLKSVSFILALGASVIAAVYLIRKISLRGKKDESSETWGCGYQKSSARVQYTADSFSQPLSAVSRAITGKDEAMENPKGILPKKAFYKSGLSDVIESFFAACINKFTGRFFGSLANVQSGNMQHYILYGLIFLLAAFVYALAVK